MPPRLDQILRYGIIGLASNGLGYLAYLGLTGLGMPPKATMTGLYATATAIAFFGNRTLTFGHDGCIGLAAFRFALVYLAGWVLNLTLLFVFVDFLGHPHWLVQGIAILIVAAILYLLQLCFVFPAANNPQSSEPRSQ